MSVRRVHCVQQRGDAAGPGQPAGGRWAAGLARAGQGRGSGEDRGSVRGAGRQLRQRRAWDQVQHLPPWRALLLKPWRPRAGAQEVRARRAGLQPPGDQAPVGDASSTDMLPCPSSEPHPTRGGLAVLRRGGELAGGWGTMHPAAGGSSLGPRQAGRGEGAKAEV